MYPAKIVSAAGPALRWGFVFSGIVFGAWGWLVAQAATVDVAAGNSSALSTAVTNAKPGDTIVLLGGTYNTGITTHTDGTAALPITVIGTNGAKLNSSVTTTGSGISCSNDYWVFQNIAINGFQKSVRIDNGSHGILNGLVCTNSGNESIKLKNSSQYWLVENCSVSNAGMEGFYCGDADQNWEGGVPDQTGYVTFYHDTAFQTYNDGFDSKEATHDIRIIDCSVDWNNTVPGGNDEGDSGVYDRANGIQIVNLNAKNNGSVGNGVRANRLTAMNGVAYGSGAQIYGLVLNNMQGTLLSTNQSDTALYTNYSMTNVAGGLGDSGHTQPNPATFSLTGWNDPSGSFPTINMVWDNSQSAVGNGTTWDYNQQNFNDPGVNGNIPVIFFQGVNVVFNDSNNGHYNVNIGASVSPAVVIVNNSSGNYVFSGSGAITGAATLTKSGTGALTISNADTYNGNTTVNGGTLVVNGSVSSSAFIVNSSGTLQGSGSIGGSVTIASGGTLKPGNFFGATSTPGALHLDGGVTFSSGSDLNIVLMGNIPGTQYSQLQVQGQENFGGTLDVSLSGFLPQENNSFDILVGGSRSGMFSTVNLPTMNGRIMWDSSQLYTTGNLTVLKTYYAGDFNRDGYVNAADISAMMAALLDLHGYESAKGLTDPQLLLVGDVNGDGKVNNADIQALLNLLKSGRGSTDPVPEPGTSILLIIGLAAFFQFTSKRRPIALALCFLAVIWLAPQCARAATPVVVQNEAGFEGLEEPTVIYFPDTNTFENDPTNFQNHMDEGGGLFRDMLRNYYSTLGWWDGDGADAGNTDRQRVEPKGIVGLGHQQVEQTFEYSFDFRTDPTFQATSDFCHIFQLKATNGDDSPPLATISLYKSGSGIQGRVDAFSDGSTGNTTESIPVTFSYTAGQWIHFDIRITPCAAGESTGQIQLSVNGGAFTGITNAPVDLTGSTDFRPKFGFYRGISTTDGVPAGLSWVEHDAITGYIGTNNVLTWNGTATTNTWDNNTTLSFLNGASATSFGINDEINFTDAAANTTVNISGNVFPNYIRFNSSKDYTISGTGSIVGGTLRKDGAGTLTLATTNSYDGLTDVTAGTLFVTGSIGNTSLVSITGGTLKAGSTAALGTNSTIGTQIDGGTLDINGFNLTTEPISVDGTGAGGVGAIINSGAQQTSALTNVTLTGDTTFGGTGRWDIRGTGATLSTGGGSYNLTKTGTNQVSFVGTNVDAALGNISINQGELCFQTSTTSMGDPNKTVTVASGAVLGFYNTSAVMSKLCTLNGGTIWGESGTGTQNTFSGVITLGASGGVFDAGSALTGGTPNTNAVLTLSGAIGGIGTLTKNGPGTVTISGSTNTWSGGTNVNGGTLTDSGMIPGTILVNSTATLQGAGSVAGLVTVASGGTISPGTGGIGTMSVGSLTLNSGATAVFQLGGATSVQFDQIHSTGKVMLGGTLSVSLTNNFLPFWGTSFDLFNWTSESGTFSALNLPTANGRIAWNTTQLYTTGAISVAATYLAGDFNRDGYVNAADLSAMMAALPDLHGYEFAKGLTDPQLLLVGDVNGDGKVTNADLQALLSYLKSGGGSTDPVPEPEGIVLLSLGILALLFQHRGGLDRFQTE
ncbi:MAG TPA: dockerin type I domain-containing protein [Pirellulales bacterium]|nr:dockerin type I domain-containing protein [Pirellulales bacterium]